MPDNRIAVPHALLNRIKGRLCFALAFSILYIDDFFIKGESLNMDLTQFKIVADSSADMLSLDNINFKSAPLKIITTNKEYVDDSALDITEMVNFLKSYKGKSSTSCPNTSDWLEAFGDSEYVFCVTITGTLSGSYNSACLAKRIYEEKHPDRKVFVLDSLSTGPEISLIIEKTQELVLAGKSFDEVCNEVSEYSKSTGLLFVLESMNNLANNGRISPLVAKMAGFLGIRLIGKASKKGDLEPLGTCRGSSKALENVVKQLKELGFKGGKIKIGHCLNEKAGAALSEQLKSIFKTAQIELYQCRGLCSFYAEKGGLLVGFETL